MQCDTCLNNKNNVCKVSCSMQSAVYEHCCYYVDTNQLQNFAQWLWDSHLLINEAFTINLVETYKENIK